MASIDNYASSYSYGPGMTPREMMMSSNTGQGRQLQTHMYENDPEQWKQLYGEQTPLQVWQANAESFMGRPEGGYSNSAMDTSMAKNEAINAKYGDYYGWQEAGSPALDYEQYMKNRTYYDQDPNAQPQQNPNSMAARQGGPTQRMQQGGQQLGQGYGQPDTFLGKRGNTRYQMPGGGSVRNPNRDRGTVGQVMPGQGGPSPSAGWQNQGIGTNTDQAFSMGQGNQSQYSPGTSALAQALANKNWG